MMHPRYWIAAGVSLAVLLVWLVFFWEPGAAVTGAQNQMNSLSQTKGPPPGGDFRLDTPDGPLSLKDFRGKIVLVYFGYTFCPDVCPTSLSAMGQAFSALSSEEQARVRGIFVSVDPERDTMEVLRTYAPFFHPNIIGASGTPEQVTAIARRYGVSYMKQKSIDGRPYSVDHSSFTYLIAADGSLAATLPHGTSVATMVNAIRQQLALPSKN